MRRHSDDNDQNVSWSTFKGAARPDQLKGNGDDLMKMKNLKTKVIGPILLLIPMACMHLGDGHHDGGHHSGDHHSSIRHSTYERATSSAIESLLIRQNRMMAQEGTETQPEGEKGG